MNCDFGNEISTHSVGGGFDGSVQQAPGWVGPSRSCVLAHCVHNSQGETFFLFTLAPPPAASSWRASAIACRAPADCGLSGKLCPGPSTCLTVMLILELRMYLEHTAQSSSASGSIAEDAGPGRSAWERPCVSSAGPPGGPGTMRGTAW